MKNFISDVFNNVFKKKNRSSNDKKGASGMTKIASIIIAIVLWMYVIGEVNPEILSEIKNIEVKLVNIEKLEQAGLVVMGQDYYAVNIKVKGRRSDVVNITSQDINAIADIRGFGKGESSIPVEINLPSNLEVESINPIQIKVTLDEVVRRSKPVQIQYTGSAAQGYIHGTPVIDQPEIMVSGPETYVKSVENVVATVDLNSTDQDIHQKFTFVMVDSEGKEVLGVQSEEKYVSVNVPIFRVKSVPVNVNTVGVAAEGFEIVSVIQIPSRVDIMGRDEDLEPIKRLDAQQISFEGIAVTSEIPLDINLPENVKLVNPNNPPRVRATVEAIKNKVSFYSPEEIQIQGLTEGYSVEILGTNSIKLTAEDIESVIETLSKEDITISIDLNNLEEGEHSVRVTWLSDKEIKTVKMEEETVDVRISKVE